MGSPQRLDRRTHVPVINRNLLSFITLDIQTSLGDAFFVMESLVGAFGFSKKHVYCFLSC